MCPQTRIPFETLADLVDGRLPEGEAAEFTFDFDSKTVGLLVEKRAGACGANSIEGEIPDAAYSGLFVEKD